MNPKLTPQPDPTPMRQITAAELLERLRNMGDNLIAIAHDYVTTLDARPQFKQECLNLGAPHDLLQRLERAGRKCMIPELILRFDPGAQRIMTLPLSDQRKAIAEGIEVMDEDEETTRLIPLSDLTLDQSRQAIDRGKVRSLAEQRSYIRKRKARRIDTTPTNDVRIHKDFVDYKTVRITKRQMLQWLQEMS